MATVYTIGHSNTPMDHLLHSLQAAGITLLADVRRYPSSRRNPQFNGPALAASLRAAGIDYVHAEALGGRRDPARDSRNTALTSDGFRGYADYALTPAFDAALQSLLALADEQPTAVMCAEAQPAGCHRSLLADALVARGHEVVHLIGDVQKAHTLSPLGRVEGERVVYPSLL